MRTVRDTSAAETRVPGVAQAGASRALLGTEFSARVHHLPAGASAVGSLPAVRPLGDNGLVQQRSVHRLREDVVAHLYGADRFTSHIFCFKFHDEPNLRAAIVVRAA